MTKDDVLFGYRLQLFAEAARTNVSAACRTFGVHRSTYYAWKRQVDRHGLEMLRPTERRRPQMPNALPKMIEERIVAFSIAHPGLGPKRVASELAREKWGGIIVSPNGVWKVLCRHGLNTRAKRLPGLLMHVAHTTAPGISSLRLSAKSFRAAKLGPSFRAAQAGVGAFISFTLSEPGTVRFTIDRSTTGRRVGGRCVKTTSANRGGTPCRRWVAVKGSFSVPGKEGANRIRLRGRLGGRTLALGAYRLNARETDLAALRSATKRTTFKIVADKSAAVPAAPGNGTQTMPLSGGSDHKSAKSNGSR